MRLPDFSHEQAADTQRFASMTPEKRLQLLFELCELTDSIQAGRPDVCALRQGTPLSPETEALLQRLRRGQRGG